MKKQLLLFVFLTCSAVTFAQNNLLWQSYFSYNQVNDLTESPNRITAATQKAIFSKNLANNELKTITTIDGLSGQDISAIYYSATFNKTIIGHANGLVLVRNEADGSIRIIPGIRDQTGLTPTRKKINHFLEHEGMLYVSTDFGVVQFNLNNNLFGDTYLIGTSGQETIAYQTAISNGTIYVATDNQGIRSASLSNPNLNDFAQWQTFDGGFWRGIVAHGNMIAGLNTNNIVYRYNGSSFSVVVNLPQAGIDFRSYDGNLIVTTANHVYTFDNAFSQTSHYQHIFYSDENVSFNCATQIGSTLFVGTNEVGIISVPLNNLGTGLSVKPDGPSRNNIFALSVTPSGKIWAVYGGYNVFYTPDVSSYGISKFSQTGWLNIPYDEVLEAHSLVRIAVNPLDENNVFISSFHNGLLEIQNDVVISKYDHTTPNGPEALDFPDDPNYKSVRINGLAFDRNNDLWFNNSRVVNAMKVRRANGSWQSFSVENFANAINQSYSRMVIDKNGTKWFGSEQNALVGFNENVTPNFKSVTSDEDLGLPLGNNMTAVAIDNNNRLWIGSMKGLRVMPGVDRFLGEDELKSNPIIIMEDGLAQELLYEQYITDIRVDGANRKWIGTADSGAFLVSSNGQETIHHFTRENSPLPSNNIYDIDINEATGEVFFATEAGMISFLGTSTKGAESLANVYIYPNPVRPEFTGTVKIAGLIDDANVKITDIEGNLVYETTSQGGTIEWDTKAFGKYRVASGVYMVFIASKDGTETKVKKVMIVR